MGRRKVLLWHPSSPGMRVLVRPCLMRRLGLVRSDFATLSEVIRSHRERGA